MLLKDKIKAAREAEGLTTYELADLVGVNQSTIARIESGSLSPSIDLLKDIARVLKIKIEITELI